MWRLIPHKRIDILLFPVPNTGVEIAPTAEEVAGFDKYIETYKAGLAIEKAAVENKK